MRRVRRIGPEEESSATESRTRPSLRSTHGSPADELLRLQRAAGNASVSALLEEEGAAVASSVKEVVGSAAGRPLDNATLQAMEARLGQDFSAVRIHDDSKASDSARAVNAAAYTVGNEIVLGDSVSPQTQAGQQTLAHELTHVVQQRSGPVAGTPVAGGIAISDPGDRFEQNAERTASRAMGGVLPASGSAPLVTAVQRETDETLPFHFVQRTSLAELAATAKEKIFGDEDQTAKVEKAEQAVDRAQTALKVAAGVLPADAAEHARQASEHLEHIAKPIGTYLKISKVVHFVEAVKEFEKSDPIGDKQGFAKAAGKFFASTGELGDFLPDEAGPVKFYFDLLKGAGDFFTRMLPLVNIDYNPIYVKQAKEAGIEWP